MSLLSSIRAIRGVVFFWETPDRSISVKLVTQDNRISRFRGAVHKGIVLSPQDDTYEAWQIDSSNLTKDPDGGRTLVLWENTCIPPALFHANPAAWAEAEINKLFSENYEEGKTVSINKNNRDMALYIMFGIGAMIVIATMLYVSADLLKNGNLDSFFNGIKNIGKSAPVTPLPGVK